jgi:hypothetical protein
MENSIFLLAKDPDNACHDLIFHRDGTLRVKVVCLGKRKLKLNPEEIQFFAVNNGVELMFETVDYNEEDPALVIDAIRWYANYLGNPEMEIEAEML